MTLRIRRPFPNFALRGVIARRILVNWRVDPAAARRLVPPPFRPVLVRGQALAGVCLIRLEHVRPSYLPASGFSFRFPEIEAAFRDLARRAPQRS